MENKDLINRAEQKKEILCWERIFDDITSPVESAILCGFTFLFFYLYIQKNMIWAVFPGSVFLVVTCKSFFISFMVFLGKFSVDIRKIQRVENNFVCFDDIDVFIGDDADHYHKGDYIFVVRIFENPVMVYPAESFNLSSEFSSSKKKK